MLLRPGTLLLSAFIFPQHGSSALSKFHPSLALRFLPSRDFGLPAFFFLYFLYNVTVPAAGVNPGLSFKKGHHS